MQLKIKDIHIRYEDNISCPGRVFACGIHVESLTAQTCDDNWTPKFVPYSSQGIVYKLLELEGLAVYWDTNTEIFSDLSGDKLSEKLMQPCCVERHEFLLAPVNGYAHLKRNCSAKPLRSLNQPRVACDVQLDKVNVELRDTQYHQLVHCCRSLELLSRGLQFRRFRSDSEPGSQALRRWRFVKSWVQHHVQKRLRGRNWPYALQRAKDIVLYVRSFKDHLLNPSGVAAETKLHREKLEAELDLEDLQILRTIAMQQIAKLQPPKSDSFINEAAVSAGSSTLLPRWISSWWSYSEPDSQQTPADDRVEHEIMETLEDAMRDNTVRQRDILPLQLSNTLKQGVFRLSTCRRTETGQSWDTLLELECDNLVQEWESRPRLKSHKFHLSLGNVWVRDCSTRGTLFPLIVSPLRKDTRVPKTAYGVTSLIPAFNLPFFRSPPTSPVSSDQKEEPIFDLVMQDFQNCCFKF